MLLEVIATTVSDAVIAEKNGADRIELITGIREGGLTPSLGLIEGVREAVNLPVRVMVRPHARSFRYDEADVQTMLRDIRHIAAVGGLSLVMGMLRPDRTVDEELLKRLLQAADGLEVTFHRAFDEAENQLAALEILSRYPQITDILTSGGQNTAPEGKVQIADLERMSSTSSVSILAGSGLTADGLSDFIIGTGVRRVHLGSAVREDGDPLKQVDPVRVQSVRSILNSVQGDQTL